MIASQLGCNSDDICDFELQACDTQPSTVAGINKEFIYSGRLDNLCMSFCSLKVHCFILLNCPVITCNIPGKKLCF